MHIMLHLVRSIRMKKKFKPNILKQLRFALLLVICQIPTLVSAQKTWTLEACIEYAIANNLQIKQSSLNMELQEQNLQNNQVTQLPSVNGFAGNVFNFGQTIDPFTNQFAQSRVRSNQFGLNAQMTLFSGLQQRNTIESEKMELQAQRHDLDKARNDISLAVANAYLNILVNQELLKVAENQVAITEKQLNQTKKLFSAGAVARGNVYDIEAQLANEELNKTRALNNLELSILSLQQLLQMQFDPNFTISKPAISLEENVQIGVSPENVYNRSLAFLPEIKSAEMRIDRSVKMLQVSRGGLSPRLTLSGSIGTGYSGLAQRVVGTETIDGIPVGTTVSGELVTTSISRSILETQPFSDQLNQNFNQSIGINMIIPLFNGYNNKTNIERAKINQEISQNQLEITKNNIRQDIQNAYANARAAMNEYQSLQKSVAALNEAFKYTEERFNVGVINSIQYNESKTLLTNAQANLIRAKYNYIFTSKVLDFYQGNPITLN